MEPKFISHDPPRRYSKACVYGNFIFLAGEDSKDPKTQEVRGTNVVEQIEYLFQNMKATLEGLGSSLSNVIKTTVYKASSPLSPKYSHLGCAACGSQDADRNRGCRRNP